MSIPEYSAYFANGSVTLLERVELMDNSTEKYTSIARIRALLEPSQNRYETNAGDTKIIGEMKVTIQTNIGDIDGKKHRLEIGSKIYVIDEIIESPAIGNLRVYEIKCRHIESEV